MKARALSSYTLGVNDEVAMSSPYWFRAKRYGWGWTPATWQGWAALAAFVALLAAASVVFPPRQAMLAYVACSLGLSVLLVVVCRIKGEPTRWRWGDDQQPKP
jgi:hypothetical protein